MSDVAERKDDARLAHGEDRREDGTPEDVKDSGKIRETWQESVNKAVLQGTMVIDAAMIDREDCRLRDIGTYYFTCRN